MSQKEDIETIRANFVNAWMEIKKQIDPFYGYIEGILLLLFFVTCHIISGVPLPTDLQNIGTFVKISGFIGDVVENYPFEPVLLERIMQFVQDICLKLIKPKLVVTKGHELFQLIRSFWEKFVFSIKIIAFAFGPLVF
jgi:hypothetical protein